VVQLDMIGAKAHAAGGERTVGGVGYVDVGGMQFRCRFTA
jgi:hypothetical protein